MDATELATVDQPLLRRRLVTYRVALDGATPSTASVHAGLSGRQKGTLVVRHVYPIQGEQAAIAHCRVYADKDAAKRLELASTLAKQEQPAKEAPAAEAAASEQPAETPADAPAEEQ